MVGGCVVLLLGVAMVACAPRPAGVRQAPAPAAAGDEPPAVTLERTPCFGTCPVYRVAISRSGVVRFSGNHHVLHREGTDTIPAARVDSLLGELEAGGYFGFADAYVMDSPACGMYATDSPTVITSATRDGVTKTIRHDRGCAAAPAELSQLEQRIDEVAGTGRWTGGR
jgi:Domain of unknown function (DUF6438)